MYEKKFFFESSNHCNYYWVNDFILHMKYKLSIYKNDHNYSINTITKLMYEEEDRVITQYLENSNLFYFNVAFMKKIIKTWIDNLTNHNKYTFTSIDNYYNNFDYIIFFNNPYDINDKIIPTVYDGNEMCDQIINMILIHLIIKHILIFISNNYIQYNKICYKILKNFRIGLYKYFDIKKPENYNKTFFQIYENNDLNIYIFYIEQQIEYNLTCFNYNTFLILKEIKLLIPWILSNFYNIFYDNNQTFDFLFIPIITNALDLSNVYEIIENDFNYYLLDVKKFKDVIYNLNLINKCPNNNINITKRIQCKERKIRNSKI